MRVIIAGSREGVTLTQVAAGMKTAALNVTEVVSGTARGADRAGEEWAIANQIPVRRFPADWNRYGKSAGPRRNEEMANYADALVAFWDGKSKGTKHMIETAKRKGLYTVVHRV
jgi:hypothetical protein